MLAPLSLEGMLSCLAGEAAMYDPQGTLRRPIGVERGILGDRLVPHSLSLSTADSICSITRSSVMPCRVAALSIARDRRSGIAGIDRAVAGGGPAMAWRITASSAVRGSG